MQWMNSVSDSPLKRLLKLYYGQFGDDTINDWATATGIPINKVPQEYRDHAKLVDTVGPIGRVHLRAGLLKYIDRGAPVIFNHRAARWKIYLDLMPADVEWDDSMVSPEIKPTVGQMIYAIKFALELFQHDPAYSKLLQELVIELDVKNLTLELKDKLFPDIKFPTRIGFIVEKA